MNGCIYRTADNQCQKYSDPVRNTMSWCVGNEPCDGRTPSNADRLRAMTDEEMAEFLFNNVSCSDCTMHGGGCSIDCEKWMLSWLKSPVEEVDK